MAKAVSCPRSLLALKASGNSLAVVAILASIWVVTSCSPQHGVSSRRAWSAASSTSSHASSSSSRERPLTVTPYRFDTSDKFYVAKSFGTCIFKMGDTLDVPPFQWSMCSSGTRCWATDAKTGTPCTLWSDAVQTADTLPGDGPPYRAFSP